MPRALIIFLIWSGQTRHSAVGSRSRTDVHIIVRLHIDTTLHSSYTLKFNRFIMLQLTTVLCILISAASIWHALTPPQPLPLEGEYAEWTVLEYILGQRYILFTLNVSHRT